MKLNPKPEIIIMDYRIPMMDGIETMKEIHKINPDTRILFVSADERVKEKAINDGAVTFLCKPVSLKEIYDAIQKVS